MPSTEWSAPADAGNSAPFVQSTITAAVLDISPGTYLIPAGSLDAGTRLRITAWGSYIATTTASTMAFGFYMNNPGATILTTPAVLTLGPAATAVAVAGMPWMLEYWGAVNVESTTTGTAGSIVGRGRFTTSPTSWVTAQTSVITPQSIGAQTVAQTATGMVTYNEQNIFVGCTVTTATGLTSITTNELTCELLG